VKITDHPLGLYSWRIDEIGTTGVTLSKTIIEGAVACRLSSSESHTYCLVGAVSVASHPGVNAFNAGDGDEALS